ncbi:MAG TPA: hemerythrin family protein [Steroidobacteraceae bacterium]
MNADVRADAANPTAAAPGDVRTEADRTHESDSALILPYLEAVAPSGAEASLLALAIDRFALIEHLHGAEAAEVIARHLLSSFQSASLATRPTPVRTALDRCIALVADGLEAAEALALGVANEFGRKSWSGLGQVTVSTGLAQRYPGESVGSWWSRVESALAQAKAGGGGHVVVDRRRRADDATGAPPGMHLQWQARFECGEPTIDRQHRELFERSEQILESLRKGSPQFVPDLERLMSEIAVHFADEEAILEQCAYPGLAGHRRSHEALTAKALRLQAEAAAGRISREELTRFLLGEVVADHMLTEDRRFAELFAAAPRR